MPILASGSAILKDKASSPLGRSENISPRSDLGRLGGTSRLCPDARAHPCAASSNNLAGPCLTGGESEAVNRLNDGSVILAKTRRSTSPRHAEARQSFGKLIRSIPIAIGVRTPRDAPGQGFPRLHPRGGRKSCKCRTVAPTGASIASGEGRERITSSRGTHTTAAQERSARNGQGVGSRENELYCKID